MERHTAAKVCATRVDEALRRGAHMYFCRTCKKLALQFLQDKPVSAALNVLCAAVKACYIILSDASLSWTFGAGTDPGWSCCREPGNLGEVKLFQACAIALLHACGGMVCYMHELFAFMLDLLHAYGSMAGWICCMHGWICYIHIPWVNACMFWCLFQGVCCIHDMFFPICMIFLKACMVSKMDVHTWWQACWQW